MRQKYGFQTVFDDGMVAKHRDDPRILGLVYDHMTKYIFPVNEPEASEALAILVRLGRGDEAREQAAIVYEALMKRGLSGDFKDTARIAKQYSLGEDKTNAALALVA